MDLHNTFFKHMGGVWDDILEKGFLLALRCSDIYALKG